MTKKEFFERMAVEGFNNEALSTLLHIGVARINELKLVPIEGQIYYRNDNNRIAQIIEDWCNKHDVNFENFTDEQLEDCFKIITKERATKIEVNIGTILPNGEEIVKIQKSGKNWAYITKEFNVYTQQEIIKLYK